MIYLAMLLLHLVTWFWDDLVLIGEIQAGYVHNAIGVAHLFDINTGELLQTIHNPVTRGHNNFGNAVALGEDFAVVAAKFGDIEYYGNEGIAYIYELIKDPILDQEVFGVDSFPGLDVDFVS